MNTCFYRFDHAHPEADHRYERGSAALVQLPDLG
jgi:hypothetical protein